MGDGSVGGVAEGTYPTRNVTDGVYSFETPSFMERQRMMPRQRASKCRPSTLEPLELVSSVSPTPPWELWLRIGFSPVPEHR